MRRRLTLAAVAMLSTTAPALALPKATMSVPTITTAAPAASPPAATQEPAQGGPAPSSPVTPPRAPEPAPFSLWQFLASAIVAVVAAVVSAFFAPLWRDRWTARNDAKVSGLRLALLLEEHASRCVQLVHQIERARPFTRPPPKDFVPLADYPADTAWRVLGYELTEAALSFRTYRSAHVAAAGSPPLNAFWQSELSARSLVIAHEALTVADQLRKTLELPPAIALSDGHVRTTIREAIATAEAVEDD